MEERGGHYRYPECKHIPTALLQELTEEQIHGLPKDEEEGVLPLFEQKISNNKRIKLYSLQTNEKLKCQWQSYIQNIAGKVENPYEFPHHGDLHYHLHGIKFMPSLTTRNRPNFRMQMSMGPGCDQYGEIPTPNDIHIRYYQKKNTKSSKANQNEATRSSDTRLPTRTAKKKI